MIRIIFWNVEHISARAVEIAEEAAEAARQSRSGFLGRLAQRPVHETTRPVTRHGVATGQVKRSRGDDAPDKRYQLNRDERTELAREIQYQRATRTAELKQRKYLLSEDLPASRGHVFLSEVVSSHPAAQNPLPGHGAPGGQTLCYAHYRNGASMPFTICPYTQNWAGANHPILRQDGHAAKRMPKAISITGRGGPIWFCFWHAPSGNNGQVVANAYADLAASGANFVLFGDLNAEPHQITGRGVPPGHILRPPGGTRISNRCLDYAVTNVPNAFNLVRPLYVSSGYQIKERTGSDHMVMVLELK